MKTLQQPGRETRGRSGEGGFTLVDLMAVCVVVALLVVLCIPALARTKGQTHRAQCASNLKQFALAHQLYATENGGQLPGNGFSYWNWDVDVPVLNVMVQWISWRQLYCPGTSTRFSETDNLGLWGGSSGFLGRGFRVIGYGVTLPGTSSIFYTTNANATLVPSGNPPPNSSQRVLIADATISLPGQNNLALRNTYNYTDITGGAYPKAHLSAHVDGRLPIGGNLAMLDGHVEWRDFEKLIPRTQGSSPVFWW
jgi:prepilin-type processing-associated H-X9-DG protein